jgi:hypothetical protein
MRRGTDVIGHLENKDARHATLMRTIDQSRRMLNTRAVINGAVAVPIIVVMV